MGVFNTYVDKMRWVGGPKNAKQNLLYVLSVSENEVSTVLQEYLKEIVERRHGEPIKFPFLPKMGLLGSQASTT